jgi:hypothetical protein
VCGFRFSRALEVGVAIAERLPDFRAIGGFGGLREELDCLGVLPFGGAKFRKMIEDAPMRRREFLRFLVSLARALPIAALEGKFPALNEAPHQRIGSEFGALPREIQGAFEVLGGCVQLPAKHFEASEPSLGGDVRAIHFHRLGEGGFRRGKIAKFHARIAEKHVRSGFLGLQFEQRLRELLGLCKTMHAERHTPGQAEPTGVLLLGNRLERLCGDCPRTSEVIERTSPRRAPKEPFAELIRSHEIVGVTGKTLLEEADAARQFVAQRVGSGISDEPEKGNCKRSPHQQKTAPARD